MKTMKRKILFVDDDANLSQLLSKGLAAYGYETRMENDSTRALEAARAFKPDLIVLDVDMPGMDGGDVAHQLSEQKDTCSLPILFLTSLMVKDDAVRFEKTGETILSKPIRIVDLAQHIEKRLAATGRT
ncbi:MAG: response regulator [Kiritimatiellia bacterium]